MLTIKTLYITGLTSDVYPGGVRVSPFVCGESEEDIVKETAEEMDVDGLVFPTLDELVRVLGADGAYIEESLLAVKAPLWVFSWDSERGSNKATGSVVCPTEAELWQRAATAMASWFTDENGKWSPDEQDAELPELPEFAKFAEAINGSRHADAVNVWLDHNEEYGTWTGAWYDWETDSVEVSVLQYSGGTTTG